MFVDFYRTARCYIPQNSILHSGSCRNLQIQHGFVPLTKLACYLPFISPDLTATLRMETEVDSETPASLISLYAPKINALTGVGICAYFQIAVMAFVSVTGTKLLYTALRSNINHFSLCLLKYAVTC
jgi:hypothetical protein